MSAGHNMKVLIVEDDTGMREVYIKALQRWGYEPVVASGRGAALVASAKVKAREHCCTVALVDMRLRDDTDPTDIRGLDLIAALKPTVCIVVSGHGDQPTTRQALLEKGAFDFFGKDEAPEHLQSLIAKAVGCACICEYSGVFRTPHWHPLTAGHLHGGVLTAEPAGTLSLASFYSRADSTKIVRVLTAIYNALLAAATPFDDWSLQQATIAESLYEVYAPTINANSAHAAHQVELALPSTGPIRLLNPIAWLAAKCQTSIFPQARRILSHRKLSIDGIQVDAKEDPWLENINHANFHHRLYDIVTVEVDIFVKLVPLLDDQPEFFYELVIAVTAPKRIDEPIRPTRRLLEHRETLKAFEVIVGLHRLAHEQQRYTDSREYVWALLLETVLRTQQATADQLDRRLWLLAGILCMRLEHWEASAWPGPGLPSVTWVEPSSYRHTTVRQLFRAIQFAESCAVVGLQHMSQRRLIQHFVMRPDVQQQYLRGQARTTLLALADCYRLRAASEHHLYELLLTALTESCRRHPNTQQILGELQRRQLEAILSDNALLAQRHLEHVIAILCYEMGMTICFILDRFDKLYRAMPADVLTNLCALRDQYAGQVCYVLGLSTLPERIRPTRDSDEFDGLFARSIVWLPSDGFEEANSLIQKLALHYDQAFDDTVYAQIIEVSGCHPALIEVLFASFAQEGVYDGDELPAWGIRQPAVKEMCARIWGSLAYEERRILNALVEGKDARGYEGMARFLINVGILRKKGKDLVLFSSIFTEYVRGQPVFELLRIDKNYRVWRGTSAIDITGYQFRMLHYLYERSGESCFYDDLLIGVFGADEAKHRSREDLQELAAHIRRRIELNSKIPRYLLLDKNPGGYRLVGTERFPEFEE